MSEGCQGLFLIVVITRLDEINSVNPDNIYKSMLLCNSARPDTRSKKFKRFRFADTLEWISYDRFDQLKNTDDGFAVCLNPVPQIFPELRLEYGFPLSVGLGCLDRSFTQNQPRFEGRQLFEGCRIFFGPCQEQIGAALH